MNNVTEIKIRGYHLDLYGHVNNARYLEFIEEARWNLFDNQIEQWVAKGVSFFVVNINISYRSPALLNTTIEIHSAISKYGSRSCVLNQRLIDQASGRLVAEADVTFVIVDSTGKAVKIEDDVLENLKVYGVEA